MEHGTSGVIEATQDGSAYKRGSVSIATKYIMYYTKNALSLNSIEQQKIPPRFKYGMKIA